jgi:hypothetical protein
MTKNNRMHSHVYLSDSILLSANTVTIVATLALLCFVPMHNAPAQPTTRGNIQHALSSNEAASRFEILYSTYLGGSGSSGTLHTAAVDRAGNIYFVGSTESADFPIVGNVLQPVFKGYEDAVIVKFNPRNNSIIYSTYLGGRWFDDINAIAIAQNDDIIVTGFTYSGDFPVTPGSYSQRFRGESDGFVTRIDSAGRNIIFSTYIGGSDKDCPIDIVLMGNGNICISGDGRSADFPTTANAWKRRNTGDNDDGFVAILSGDGSRVIYSTYVGGSFTDYVQKCKVGPRLYVYGSTRSGDYPTTENAAQRTMGGDQDLFFVALDTADYRVLYSSYIGGSRMDDTGFGSMLLDESGESIYMNGETTSDDLPVTPGAFMPDRPNAGTDWVDIFLLRIDSRSYRITGCTYFGGNKMDGVYAIQLMGPFICFSGATQSATLPTTPDAFRRQNQQSPRNYDGFFMVMDTTFSNLIYGTLIGGDKLDGNNCMVFDPSTVYLYGRTESKDFPITENAMQKTLNGEGDMFIMILKYSDLSAREPLARPPGSPRIVSVSPNPSTSAVRLEIESPVQTSATAKLHALDGREMKDLGIAALHSGVNIFTFDVSLLPSGEYILSVETRRGKCVKKMVKE